MIEEFYKLEESIGFNARHLSKALRTEVRKRFKANKLNVKIEEWITLAFLFRNSDKNQIQLGELLMLDKTAITRLLDEMEAKKQIKRVIDKEDKRNRIVKLTAEGKKAYKKILPIVEKTIQDAMKNIDLNNYRITIDTLQKMSDNLTKE